MALLWRIMLFFLGLTLMELAHGNALIGSVIPSGSTLAAETRAAPEIVSATAVFPTNSSNSNETISCRCSFAAGVSFGAGFFILPIVQLIILCLGFGWKGPRIASCASEYQSMNHDNLGCCFSTLQGLQMIIGNIMKNDTCRYFFYCCLPGGALSVAVYVACYYICPELPELPELSSILTGSLAYFSQKEE